MNVQQGDDRTAALDILRSLRAILRHVTSNSKRLARETGLTLPQAACLRELGSREATIAELARALDLSSPTLTGVVDRLERRGLVRRTRGTTDRRKVYVSLTDQGRDQLLKMPEHSQEKFFAALMSLEPSERMQLQESLERIVELMEAESGYPVPAPYLAPEEKLD